MAGLLRKKKEKAAATTIREFYANAWRLEEHKNQPPTYTTQIRGTKISFSPESIHRVLKLRDTLLPNASSYHDRKANNNLRPDEVLACLCVKELNGLGTPMEDLTS
ncbi:hypothetical protein PIB30_075357 [Stylosanthes scabra]|uniref:Uncharacterized protein n=1 Tax=Stylosanthes scabra TaxID=79078 RepID=A0ABU6QPI0_9FABA|nr:hypothetical protein [Stylosanthes scabra]